MEVGKEYSPPDCPTYVFFLGKAIDHVMRQMILREREGNIAVGMYSHNSAGITSVNYTPITMVKRSSKSYPERIIAAPLEDKVNLQLPLVQAKVGVYPNWEKFAIEKIKHPYGDAYMTGIDAVILKHDYKRKTRDKKTGETRYEFIGGTEEFDPIVRGFATWDSNYELHHPYGDEAHLVIFLEPRILKEILRQFRNKHVEMYGNFLNRVTKVDGKIKAFLEYSNEWVLKERERSQKKS